MAVHQKTHEAWKHIQKRPMKQTQVKQTSWLQIANIKSFDGGFFKYTVGLNAI